MSADVRNSSQEVGEEYASSLADLTVNSKPLINMLTMLAEENIEFAPVIVKVIEKHLAQVKPEMKLPVLYLVDSIVKNLGSAYTALFTQNIVSTFCSVFEKVDESTRASMFKLRQTWSDVFPKKLYALDVRVQSIDPAWPITAPPPTASIHLNPAFLPKEERVGYKPNSTKKSQSGSAASAPARAQAPKASRAPAVKSAVSAVSSAGSDLTEIEMRESLLKKQQELLELQQEQLKIELMQTKARLHHQQLQQQQAQPVLQVDPVPIPAAPLPPIISQQAPLPPIISQQAPLPPIISPQAPLPPIISPQAVEKLAVIAKPEVEKAAVPVALPVVADVVKVVSAQPVTSEVWKDTDWTADDMAIDEIVPPKPPTIGSLAALNRRSNSPEKRVAPAMEPSKTPPAKKPKEDKPKDKRKGDKEAEPRKKERGDRFRKAKEADNGVDEARAEENQSRNMRDAAKSMPRIPKLSERKSAPTRDPRLQKPVGNIKEDEVQVVPLRSGRNCGPIGLRKRHASPDVQAERRKVEPVKKENVSDAKKRKTNRFDDLFGNEDIDLRKVPAPPVVPPAVTVPVPIKENPPVAPGWPRSNQGQPMSRARGGWGGSSRGRGRAHPARDDVPWREGEDSWEGPTAEDGGGSPRNMDFILEQAKENHRNGVINDGEYSTIIRQVFQMSESKMIREVQRRENGPSTRDQDLRFPPASFPEPVQDRPVWNEPAMRDPRRGGYPYGRSRFDIPPRGVPPVGAVLPARPVPPVNTAFEVRPDEVVKTINIDNVAREIRFYGDTAVILMAAEDPRELGFQPGVRRVFLENVTIECAIGHDYMDFNFDGLMHRIKLGAPTRELYIDGQWYECMFGGPSITIPIGNRPVDVALEGPPPTVKIGSDRRLDLLAGRVTMIIDAHSVIPVYLDLKLQHFDMDGKVYTLQFKDSLRTVVIDEYPYRVDYGGLPMAIHLDGRKHFVRFSSLPRGVEPGRVLQPVQPFSRGGEFVKCEEEKPHLDAPVPNPVDIGELLSKLVATGLLPGTAPATTNNNKPPPKEKPKREEKIRNVNLKDPESMKVRPNAMISLMYSGMQCGSCGLRFPADQTLRYSSHLDWHFRQNRREKGASKRPQSRKWYYKVADWIQFEETETNDEKRLNWFESQANEKETGERNGDDFPVEENTSVTVGVLPEENRCVVCHEDLTPFYHEESEEWHLKDAVRVEGITYHRLCYRDHLSTQDTRLFDNESAEEPSASEEDDAVARSTEEPAAADAETSTDVPTTEAADNVVSVKSEPAEADEFADAPSQVAEAAELPAEFTESMEAAHQVKIEVEDVFIKTEDDCDMTLKEDDVAGAVDSNIMGFAHEALDSPLAPVVDYAGQCGAGDDQMTDHFQSENFVKVKVESVMTFAAVGDDSAVGGGAEVEESDMMQPDEQAHAEIHEEADNVKMEEPDELARPDSAFGLEEVAPAEEGHIDEGSDRIMEQDGDEMATTFKAGMVEVKQEISDFEPATGYGSEAEVAPGCDELDDAVPAKMIPTQVVVPETVVPVVVSHIDGNTEFVVEKAATVPIPGKIKINLFKKATTICASSPQPAQPNSPPKSPVSAATGEASLKVETGGGGVATDPAAETGSEFAPVIDEAALARKPRLIGRKLEVLPPRNKGVELSGLCSIM